MPETVELSQVFPDPWGGIGTITPKTYFRHRLGHSYAYRCPIMNHPDDDGQPTFAPENTRELDVGEKIENGDLKWHQSANEWAEIQTLGYRTVNAPQKGLFRRCTIA
jgi:hypothetical protein